MKPYYETELGKLYCGDCLEIMPELETVDLVVADPPYGIKENAHRVQSRTKLAATTDYGDFDWDNKPASREEITAIIAAGKNAIIWGGNYFHVPPARGWLVWDKLNSGNFADCELAWTNLKMSVRIFRFMWNGMIRAGEARGKKRVHPAQKPIELMMWCLSFAPNAKLILDPMSGSGTLGITCERFNRKYILIEKEKKYCEIAAKRIENERKQLKMF